MSTGIFRTRRGSLETRRDTISAKSRRRVQKSRTVAACLACLRKIRQHGPMSTRNFRRQVFQHQRRTSGDVSPASSRQKFRSIRVPRGNDDTVRSSCFIIHVLSSQTVICLSFLYQKCAECKLFLFVFFYFYIYSI